MDIKPWCYRTQGKILPKFDGILIIKIESRHRIKEWIVIFVNLDLGPALGLRT